jgi:catalase
MESSVNAMNANSQANNAAEANLVHRNQARAQYETLEQQRKGRLANAAVSGISDLMKSKKSDQLTKFNDAKEQMEQRVQS